LKTKAKGTYNSSQRVPVVYRFYDHFSPWKTRTSGKERETVIKDV